MLDPITLSAHLNVTPETASFVKEAIPGMEDGWYAAFDRCEKYIDAANAFRCAPYAATQAKSQTHAALRPSRYQCGCEVGITDSRSRTLGLAMKDGSGMTLTRTATVLLLSVEP